MCTRPISIFTKASKVPSIGGKIRFKVPCGNCFECKEQKKKNYYVRTFAEYQDLEPYIKAGKGFCYFDTLTYNNAHLPHWKGIECFNHEHIKLFLKRLRIRLKRKGYDVDGNLRYFICSEFGDVTKRPHYHVLFFVRFPIHILAFYDEIRNAWEYGFNDRKYSKVIKGKLKLGAAERVVNRNNALRYVSGYVVKDDSWVKIFNEKIDELKEKGYTPDDKTIRSIQPRFFLSKGFGYSFLDDFSAKYHFDREYYEKTGCVQLPDSSYIKQDFKLPDYYRRKIYFTLEQEILSPSIGLDDNGEPVRYKRGSKKGQIKPNVRFYWKPNNEFIEYQRKVFGEQIDNLSRKYNDIFINIPHSDCFANGLPLSEYIIKKLANRSFQDLAVYNLCYRHRLCYRCVYPDTYDKLLARLYDSTPVRIAHNLTPEESIDQENYLSTFVIRDSFCEDFYGFDEILDLLEEYETKLRKGHAALVQRLRQTKNTFKNLINSY